MNHPYLKQQIQAATATVLHKYLTIDAEPQVDRYVYASKLGTLPNIDYAMPLFGYAQQAKQSPQVIYEHLSKALADFKGQTEFVNGYLNIMVDDSYLNELVSIRSQPSVRDNPLTKVVVIVADRSKETMLATKLVQKCAHFVGLDLEVALPLPSIVSRTGHYVIEDDQALREQLLSIDGIVAETGKAIYLEHGNDSHALVSVKGAFFARGLTIAAVKSSLQHNELPVVIGVSSENALVKSLFPQAHVLDVDVHAKQINDSHDRPIADVVTSLRTQYADRGNIQSLTDLQRKELLYVLDFDYEITEAIRLGDLKRLLSEVTTLLEQNPIPNITRN